MSSIFRIFALAELEIETVMVKALSKLFPIIKGDFKINNTIIDMYILILPHFITHDPLEISTKVNSYKAAFLLGSELWT